MRKLVWVLLLTLILLGYGMYATPTLAQEKDDHADPSQAQIAPLVPVGQTARYLATFMKSNTSTAIRSSTVVTVTNQSAGTCGVSVDWFAGLSNAIACTTTASVPAGQTFDFCSRNIPTGVTTCNATCAPAPGLTLTEGRARVASSTFPATCNRIGVSARVYYTTGSTDSSVSAITDSKIVRVGVGNSGD
jgi:hypothetical protein